MPWPSAPPKARVTASGVLPSSIPPAKSMPPPGILAIACMSTEAPAPAEPRASGGSGGILPLYSDAETPAGAVNGINAAFTLLFAPSPVNSLILFRNGLLQTHGFDFSLAGNVVTFLAGSTPEAGDELIGQLPLRESQQCSGHAHRRAGDLQQRRNRHQRHRLQLRSEAAPFPLACSPPATA